MVGGVDRFFSELIKGNNLYDTEYHIAFDIEMLPISLSSRICRVSFRKRLLPGVVLRLLLGLGGGGGLDPVVVLLLLPDPDPHL